MALPEGAVTILYKNHRGETAWRRILPESIQFGKVKWHPDEQWLLWAYDLDKNDVRTFAVKDIQSWKPCTDDRPIVARMAPADETTST